ncbi:WD40 repeat-like protein [Trametes versicolor FP-101664 SS1]|uniref:WD40 repeat-like protein n=1 Tax=Trametes versicolor (strain FP-101664) TaxID=717944 RepID=UPI0004622019|nr:WD40 repeat-like protein [Trametes versicolor FP-101664 SS1]EIW58621.1 WD40 repeat-like protein [Trametes versicolor FP-101664 SS1]
MPEDAQATPVLPICTVQHDFNVVVKDVIDGLVPEDTFWVSCYKFGEPSVHGKAVAALDEHNRNLVLYQGRDGVDFKATEDSSYAIACPTLGIGETRIAVPRIVYPSPSDIRKQSQITAFDVAPDGSQFATGYHDGSVYIRSTTSSTAPPTAFSKSHLSTVTSIRFFPSSRVILSAGADFSLSILSADPPESSSYTTVKATPARTLRGHTRAITSTAIIARGRNVLSGSKDGTVRLWDIPSSSQIRTLAAGSSHFVPVLAISSGERWRDAALESTADDVDSREVETSDKVVFCGLQDGSFELFDLRTKFPVFRSPAGASGARSALQALAYSPERSLLATGSAAGLTSVYDVRTLGEGPVTTFRRNEAPIEDIVFVDPPAHASRDESTPPLGGLAIATEDGLPYVANIQRSRADVRAELVGTDCDAVRLVRAAGRHVWTAADDGVVRRYVL